MPTQGIRVMSPLTSIRPLFTRSPSHRVVPTCARGTWDIYHSSLAFQRKKLMGRKGVLGALPR